MSQFYRGWTPSVADFAVLAAPDREGSLTSLFEVAHVHSARADRVGHLKRMESAPGPCGIAVATCRAHRVTRLRAWSFENFRPPWPRR
jgi:hypothetical protein